MMFLLAALVADLILAGWAYSTGNSIVVMIAICAGMPIGAAIFFEYEKQRMRHARR
jgi:uncharacterized membrane protein